MLSVLSQLFLIHRLLFLHSLSSYKQSEERIFSGHIGTKEEYIKQHTEYNDLMRYTDIKRKPNIEVKASLS